MKYQAIAKQAADKAKKMCTYRGGFDIFDQGRRILVTGGTGQIGRIPPIDSTSASLTDMIA